MRPFPTFAIAGLLGALALGGTASGAPAGTVRTSGFGIDAVSAAAVGGRTVAVWGGGLRGETLTGAQHTPGTTRWSTADVAAGAGGVVESDLASGPGGRALAVWVAVALAPDRRVRILAARRDAAGAWRPADTLAEFPDPFGTVPALLPTRTAEVAFAPDGAAVVLVGAPDGSVVARRLPSAGDAWDAPVTLRPAPGVPGGAPDVALAIGPDGRAVALWAQGLGDARSVGIAEWDGAAWSAAGTLAGSERGYYPAAVVTADGEALAAFTRDGGTWAANRPAGGVWDAPRRIGGGYAPEIHAGGGTTAVTWLGGPGVAVRAGAGWRLVPAPLGPQVATVARDGSVVVAGTTTGEAVAWSRLARGARAWSAARIVSRPQDVASPRATALAASARGPLATLLWTGSIVPGRLGSPRGGTALQFADLTATAGTRAGAVPLLRLRNDLPPRPADAVLAVQPRFVRYTGPARVQVQIARRGAWRRLATLTVDTNRPAQVRIARPGTYRVRLAYGPRFRLRTNAVPVRVTRPGRARVVAGWSPVAIAAHGRDLWVVSGTRGAHLELRLLDAVTGRLRRGPVAVGLSPYAVELLETGGRVLLRRTTVNRVQALDPALPGLLGPDAVVTPGTCAATCTATTVTVSGVTERPSRSVGYTTSPVTGPDGRVWALGPAADPGTDDLLGTMLEAVEGGVPVERGPAGSVSGHGGRFSELIAVPGGVWMRDAGDRARWFGAAGPGVEKGTYPAIAGDGACVWGLADVATAPRVVRLREGADPEDRGITVGGTYVGAEHPELAVAPGAAWLVAPVEQTLVRVPLPACARG